MTQPCSSITRLAQITCLGIGLLTPTASLIAQVIVPVDNETVVISTADSSPVRGDPGIDGVTVQVTAAGSIATTDGPAVHGQGTGWKVENAGTLEHAGDARATVHLSEGTFTNGTDGTIQWQSDGDLSLTQDAGETLFSSVYIESWTSNASNNGDLIAAGLHDLTVTANDASFALSAVHLGRRNKAEDDPLLTFTNSGTVSARWSGAIEVNGTGNDVRITGIHLEEWERIQNNGTIEAVFDGNLADVDAGSTLDVVGIFAGEGVTLNNGNQRTISATHETDGSATAVWVKLDETLPPDADPEEQEPRSAITNSGTIRAETGDGGTAVAVLSEGNLVLTNQSSGTVLARGVQTAGGDTETEDDDVFAAPASATGILVRDGVGEVTNRGTISAEGGFAVRLENGGTLRNHRTIVGDVFLGATDDATLVIVPGSEIEGTVDAGGGNNTLELGAAGGFFGPNRGEYDGSFTGFDALLVNAPRTLWNITGDQTYATTEITAGLLQTSDLLTSDITIHDEGTLVSAGSVVGNIDVSGKLWVGEFDDDSIFGAPDSSGVLTVDGDVTFFNDSELVVIAGQTTLDATGAIVIGGNAPGDETPSQNAPRLIVTDMEWDQDHLILSGGSVTGEFDPGANHFLLLDITYNPTSVSASKGIHRDAIAAAGQTSNQRSIARALSVLNPAPGSPLEAGFREFADLGTAQNFGQFADTMNGQIIASGAAAHSSFSKNLRQTVVNTIQHRPEPDDGRFAPYPGAPVEPPKELKHRLWSRGAGAWGDLEKSGSDGRVDYRTYGLLVGADTARTEDSRAGVVVGYGNSKVSAGRDKVDGNFLQTALYASRHGHGFLLDGTLGYGFHDMESERVVQPSGEKLGASYNAHELFGSIQATMVLEEEGVMFLPLMGVDVSHFEQGSFKESGTWAIAGDGASLTSIRPFVGMRVLVEHITASDSLIVPELRFRYSHEMLDRDASFSGSFRGDPNAKFSTTGAAMNPGEFQMGLGVMYRPGGWDDVSIFADYDVSMQRQQLFSAGLRYRF